MTASTRNRQFTRSDSNAPFTAPNGYRITHRFQYQDDDVTNSGQYVQSADVESWEDIGQVVETMLNYPDSAGFTLSIDIQAIAGLSS
jgi:hypothetical protein